LQLYLRKLELSFSFTFLNSTESHYGSFIFGHLPIKVEFFTVGGLECENQFSIAFDLPLHGFAVACVTSNDAAFWGTCKVLECELNIIFVLHVVTLPSFKYLRLSLQYLEFLFSCIFLNSLVTYNGVCVFGHLPLKVECVTIGGYEFEYQFSIAFDLTLRRFAVSRVANNVTAFWGT
jgi:hypothetical protein